MTAERHPVADLLTDEMRERVRAVSFERVRNGRVAARMPNGRYACPLGVAVGLTRQSRRFPQDIFDRLGLGWEGTIPSPTLSDIRRTISSLMIDFDRGRVAPEDVKTVLGVDEERE